MVYKPFSKIDLEDPFFTSLKEDYKEFSDWYKKKADKGDSAFVLENEKKQVEAFLYLKLEDEEVLDVVPPLPAMKRLKVGTLKVNPHGTKLGERFVKKIIDYAVGNNINEAYVTVFPKHEALISLLIKYGFVKRGTKTSSNGVEDVYLKNFSHLTGDIYLDYPLIHIKGHRKYTLSIYPAFHTRLFPDSILENETYDIVQDVSHTNSIHKVYVCYMKDVANLKREDILVIYRTKDDKGPAYYRSVVTSVCVVEEVRSKASFANLDEYLRYTLPHSVFTREELTASFNRRDMFVIRMTYNAAFSKRINRARLITEFGLDESAYWGFLALTDHQFNAIIKEGGINEGIIVD